MRVASTIMVVLLLTTGVASAQEMKVPEGCVAAEGATISYDGYASRVIHQKTGIELVLVPAGSYTAEVAIAKPFYIGKTEVTNAQYKRFIEQSGYDGRADVDPVYDTYLLHLRGKSIMPIGDDFPVVFVSWHNAKAFCHWAGALDLPTEAEWGYSCLAAGPSIAQDAIEEYGWANSNSEGHPHKVAQLKPNAWGLYDMHGNVSEWGLDDYHPSAIYMTAPIMGGAWSMWTKDCMVEVGQGLGYSNGYAPTTAINDIGFRVVLRLP